MAVFDDKFKQEITDLIIELGDELPVVIAHLDGSQSRGNCVFSTSVAADESTEVGTVASKARTMYVTGDIRNLICSGDKLTADSVTYRAREVTEYKPSNNNMAYRVVVDV